MKNLFINEFTDQLRREYNDYERYAVDAEKKSDYKLAFRYRDERDVYWKVLRMYYETVLHRPRFKWQASYALKVLREMNEQYWEACFKRKRSFRKSDDSENLNVDLPT
jgi:hypothetical protein